MVPQAIGISLRNRIGDSTGDVPCFSLGFGGTMCLILLTCFLFLLVFVLHFILCSSIDTPLYWFDPWPTFYHYLLYIRRFLAKSHVHTWIFGQKSCIHVDFRLKSFFPRRFLAKSHVYGPSHAGFWPKVTYMCLSMRGFGLKSRTYAVVLYTVTYILPFGEFDVGGSCWVGCECGWVFLGSDVVCWMLLL